MAYEQLIQIRIRNVKKLAMLTALIIMGGIAASPAGAHREWRGGYGSGPGNVEDVAGAPGLNLTAEQAERIGALREVHRRDIRPLQDRLMGKGRQLRELWLAKTPDRERILALQREVHELRGQLLEKLAAYRLEVRQLLTPEQQAKMRAFEAERGMGRMDPAGMERLRNPNWGEGGQPPAGGPRRGKGPPLPMKAGG